MTDDANGASPSQGAPPPPSALVASPQPEATRFARLALFALVANVAATGAAVAGELVDSLGLLAVGMFAQIALFAIGSVVFFVAFLKGLSRSRYDDVEFAGLFLCAPPWVSPSDARPLRLALIIMVVVGLLAGFVIPTSVLPISTGFGLLAFYGASYGTYPKRTD